MSIEIISIYLKDILLKIRNKQKNVFDNMIIALICLSGITLGLETEASIYNEYISCFNIFDNLLLWVFGIEILIRIIAYSPDYKEYLSDNWNRFDIIIFILCAIPAFMSSSAILGAFYAFRMLRLLRAIKAVRILKIIPKFKQLQTLITTLFNSLPAMGYVLFLLALLFYLFAIIGHFLFAQYSPSHFSGLANSLLTLFEAVIGSWPEVMEEICSNANSQLYNVISPLYFIAFYFLAGMIALNLFIGIIVNELQQVQEETKNELISQKLENDLDAKALNTIKEINELNKELNNKINSLYYLLDKNKNK
jgi:voltage-gated sodium channel